MRNPDPMITLPEGMSKEPTGSTLLIRHREIGETEQEGFILARVWEGTSRVVRLRSEPAPDAQFRHGCGRCCVILPDLSPAAACRVAGGPTVGLCTASGRYIKDRSRDMTVRGWSKGTDKGRVSPDVSWTTRPPDMRKGRVRTGLIGCRLPWVDAASDGEQRPWTVQNLSCSAVPSSVRRVWPRHRRPADPRAPESGRTLRCRFQALGSAT